MTGRLIRQVWVEQLIFWRNRPGVFFTFVFPLLLLAFFASFADERVLVPGIAALVVVSTTFQSLAISVAFHREQGVLKRVVASPIPIGMLVGAKIASIALVAALEVLVVVLAGRFAYGLDWPVDPATFVLVLLVGLAAFSALGMGVTALIPSGDAAPAITNAIYLPMMFISGVFYRVQELPEVLQALAVVLPLHHLVEPLRAAWLGESPASPIAVHVAALALWGIAGTAWALARTSWVPAEER